MNDMTPPTITQQGMTRRAIALAGANLIAFAISFALPLLLVRTLSQAEFGIYKQIFQVLTTFVAMLNLQVAVGAIYFVAREPQRRFQVVQNILIFYLLLGLLVAVWFSLWPEWVCLVFQGNQLVQYMPMLGIAIFLWLISTNLEVVPIALGDFGIASVLIVVSQLTKAVLMIAAALVFGSVSAIVTAVVIQGVMQTIVMLWYLRRRFGVLSAPVDWQLFREQMSNALPFGVGAFAAFVQADFHHFFVSHYFDPAMFAIYSVGCMQLPLLPQLMLSFSNAIAPEISRLEHNRDYPGIVQVWAKVMRDLSLIFIPLSVLLFAVRREFITVLFTEAYAGAVTIFAINLLLIPLAVTLHLHLLRFFDALKFFRLKLNLLLIPVTWAGLYGGMQLGGLTGIAISVVLIQAFVVLATVVAIARSLQVTARDLRQLLPVVRTAVAALIAGGITLALLSPLSGQKPLISLLLCSLLYVISYGIGLLLTGAINAHEALPLRHVAQKYFHSGMSRLRLDSDTKA